MSALSRPLPPGIAPPLAADNDYNHSGLIVVITSLALFLVLASLSVRIFAATKRSFVVKDDYILLIVVICACVQVSVTLVSVQYGWGKFSHMILDRDFMLMLKAVYVADLFYVLVLGLSKICTMVFYRSLSTHQTLWTNSAILASCSVWTVLAMGILGARCSEDPWKDIDSRCAGLLPRWKATCALDIILEALILAYPTKIIYKVQIAFWKKCIVFTVLSCRIILIPLSAVHLHFVQKQTYSSTPTLIGTYATTVAELHLGVSVLVLTVSSLKMFVAVYEDEQGLAYTEDISKSQGISDNSHHSKSSLWRWSRQTKEPSMSPTGYEDDYIFRLASGARNNINAIVKSVQISVTHETRENIELGERGPPSSSRGNKNHINDV